MNNNKKLTEKKEFWKIIKKIKKESKLATANNDDNKEKVIFEYGFDQEIIEKLSDNEKDKLSDLITEEYSRKKEISSILNEEYFLEQKRKELTWRLREEVLDEIEKLIGKNKKNKKEEPIVITKITSKEKPTKIESNPSKKEEPQKVQKKQPVKKEQSKKVEPKKTKPVVMEATHVETASVAPVEVKVEKKQPIKKEQPKKPQLKKTSVKKAEPKIDEVQIKIDSFKNEKVDKMPEFAIKDANVSVIEFLAEPKKPTKKPATKKQPKKASPKKEEPKREVSKKTLAKSLAPKKDHIKKVKHKVEPKKLDDVQVKIDSFKNEKVDMMPESSVINASESAQSFIKEESKKPVKKGQPKKAKPKVEVKKPEPKKHVNTAKPQPPVIKKPKKSPLEDLIDQANHGLSSNINKYYKSEDEE